MMMRISATVAIALLALLTSASAVAAEGPIAQDGGNVKQGQTASSPAGPELAQGEAPAGDGEAGAAAAAAAIRCMAHAGLGGDGISYWSFTGSAVDCRPTWRYSFRLRLKRGSTTLSEKLLEDKSGSTSYTMPTYDYFYGTVPFRACSELRVYHSSTVGSNLVDVASFCLGGGGPDAK